jgi:signal transduction histidine kinase
MEHDLFRIGQEALTNALKYAGADEIQIDLTFEAAYVRFSVRDNGRGFDVYSSFQGNGFGLLGMHERAERHGGEMRIVSAAGQGTLLTVALPLPTLSSKGGRT